MLWCAVWDRVSLVFIPVVRPRHVVLVRGESVTWLHVFEARTGQNIAAAIANLLVQLDSAVAAKVFRLLALLLMLRIVDLFKDAWRRHNASEMPMYAAYSPYRNSSRISQFDGIERRRYQ